MDNGRMKANRNQITVIEIGYENGDTKRGGFRKINENYDI
jgi:hypothetical protein